MKYIKHPIPEEISDKGGASVQLVDKQTIPLDGAIDDAIEAHYAIGQKEFIRNGVIGTMKSMAAGVRRDGRPRSIDGFLTVYPVFKGKIDLEKGFDPAVNKVQIKARLLNELELDISNWSFEDVTPGKKAFKLNSVKAGDVLNVVKVGEAIELNGEELPSTKAGEELRVHWAVEETDKSGDIAAAKMTSDVGRADIAADALAELASDEYDGKTIVFTVRGNFSSAKISATLRAETPPQPIYESELGGLKVFAAKDSHDNALPDDELKVTEAEDQLILEGEGLVPADPAHPATGYGKIYFNADTTGTGEEMESYVENLGDGKISLSLGMDISAEEDGSYPHAQYRIECYTNGEIDSLVIPFALHKGE